MTNVVIAAVVAAAVSLGAAEVLAWFPWLAERLIGRATRLLPPDERERWRAEWLAELEAIPGSGISKLLWAVNVTAGVPVMRRTLRSRRAPTPKQPDILLLGFVLLVFLLAWQSMQRESASREAGDQGALPGSDLPLNRVSVSSRSLFDVTTDARLQPDILWSKDGSAIFVTECKFTTKKPRASS